MNCYLWGWTQDPGRAGSRGTGAEPAAPGRFVSTWAGRRERISSPFPEANPGLFAGEVGGGYQVMSDVNTTLVTSPGLQGSRPC